MTSETELRDKLRKIEALFAGAATIGEKDAAGAAADRIRERLKQAEASEEAVETKFTFCVIADFSDFRVVIDYKRAFAPELMDFRKQITELGFQVVRQF